MKKFLTLLLVLLFSFSSDAQHRSSRGHISGLAPEIVQIENPSDTFPTGGSTESVQIKTQSQQLNNHGLVVQGSSTVADPRISFLRSRGSVTSPSIVSINDPIGRLRFYGHDGTDFEQALVLQGVVDATPGTNDMSGRLEILTTPDGSTTPTLSVTIADAAGSVLVVEGSIQLDEQAAADSFVAGYGQVWVKNTSPAELWFTDDVGADFNIGSAGGGITGSGTADTLVKWISATILGNSLVSESGSAVTIAGTLIADGITASSGNNFRTIGTIPSYIFESPSQSADEKIWAFRVVGSSIDLSLLDDAESSSASVFSVTRTGTSIDLLTFTPNTFFKTSAFIREQAAADADIAGSIQLWVKNTTPTELWFTDEDGTDFRVARDSVNSSSNTTLGGSLSLLEQAAGDVDTNTYGQIWIKDSAPNELWFTDDSGVDHFVSIDSAVTASLITLEGTVALAERTAASAFTAAYGQLWVRNDSPAVLIFTDDAGSDFLIGGLGGGSVTGTGTTNKLSKWTGTTSLGDTIISEISSEIGVNTTTPDSLFDVRNSSGGIVSLTTSETTVVDGTVLGRLNFVAPEETSGGDSLFVAASVWAESEAAFSAADNSSSLVFATGESEVAVEKMRLTSAGTLITEGIKIGVAGEAAQLLHIERADVGVIQMLLENTDTAVGYGASAGFARIFVAGIEKLRFGALATTFNQGLVDTDFNIRGVGAANALFVQGSDGFVGINTNTPTSLLHVDQSNSSGVIPAIIIDQADISEGFINFVGSDRGVVATSTINSVASVRVEINGTVYVIALHVDR